jgi:hypothetical protein
MRQSKPVFSLSLRPSQQTSAISLAQGAAARIDHSQREASMLAVARAKETAGVELVDIAQRDVHRGMPRMIGRDGLA